MRDEPHVPALESSWTLASTRPSLDLFKMDFSTLLRSQSASSKPAKRHGTEQAERVVDGAKSEMVDLEDPERKNISENKLSDPDEIAFIETNNYLFSGPRPVNPLSKLQLVFRQVPDKIRFF
ncbi:hypothetical protein D9757_001346 [Collybiopsis confluens]|uniref:Uncharacterized protein n=1 Tax=Collybiopsis confluens TaxID=2823264 RepID=A0A8H5I0T8_9AGAR|nr:hypothetical protein D9757_001346 [Collybiopsis confluens]